MPGAKDASDEREPGAILTGIRIIFQTTPLTFAALLIVAAIRGFVPALAAVMAGRAVTAIPAAIEAGGLHDHGRDLGVAVIGVAMVYGADQIIGALMFPIEEGWAMRLYGRIEQRALQALASPPLLDHFLDPETRRLTDVAVKQDWPHIAPFAVACLWATTWLVGAASQALVLAQFSWSLAAATTAVWFSAGLWMRQQDLVGLWTAILGQRFAQYLRWFTMRNETSAELRLFGAAPWFIDRFDYLTRTSYREAWKVRAASARILAPLLLLLVVGNAAGIAVIARAAYVGDITVAQLAVFALVFVGLSELALPQEWTERLLWGASRLPSLVALEEIGARETARATPSAPVDVPTTSPTIRLEGRSFSYRGRPEPIIRDFDLTIDGGTSLAIVGDNGAGKTTLVRLLCRLHDPSAGRITIDGSPLTDLDPLAWQRSVAAVFQDSIRYPLTAAETVALRPVSDADRPSLVAAAEAVGSREVIDGLARGWDTVLSRRFKDGLELSGGQWQRIALVRAAFALNSGARLLILDEPTANLDVRGEAELYDRFVDLARGATTVLVSHRFSTVRRADRIVVVDHGRIVEDGSHSELMRHDGRYAALFRIQASRYGEAVIR